MECKISDNCFSHSKYSSDKYPKEFENEFIWSRCSQNENTPSIITDSYLNTALYKNKKTAWTVESEAISPSVHNENILNEYNKVFTHNKRLLNIGNKYVFVPVGGCWIDSEEQKIYEKNKKVSIITSGKQLTKGHKLRHEIVKRFKDKIDIYGTAYNPIEKKLTGLKDYMFQIVIENSKYDFYFTEKIIDCFRSGTIPIYWGCPSIGNFFDEKGIIQFNDANELENILDNIDEYEYKNMYSSIESNFNKANEYLLTEKYIIENNLLNND